MTKKEAQDKMWAFLLKMLELQQSSESEEARKGDNPPSLPLFVL